jgi:DNA-binding NtrC family response regulator
VERKRVLVVDDDAAIRAIFAALLEEEGYHVAAVDGAAAAIEALGGGEGWDLLITDNRMPGMSGTELVDEVAQLHPELPVLILSGLPLAAVPAGYAEGRVQYLMKPVRPDRLLLFVRTMLDEA